MFSIEKRVLVCLQKLVKTKPIMKLEISEYFLSITTLYLTKSLLLFKSRVMQTYTEPTFQKPRTMKRNSDVQLSTFSSRNAFINSLLCLQN